MSQKKKQHDTSTICDLLLKEWSDTYPPEKVNALMTKADSLSYTLKDTNEQFTKLSLAKSRLMDLSNHLVPIIGEMTTAIGKRNEFIAQYGDLGVECSIPQSTMEETIQSYVKALDEYAVKVNEAYFANLENVRHTIAYITSLRDFYAELAAIINSIRKEYFPTAPDRRKPIVRDLYRRFKSLADNKIFFGICPDIPNPLIKKPMDRDEHTSLMKVRKEANHTASVLKASR